MPGLMTGLITGLMAGFLLFGIIIKTNYLWAKDTTAAEQTPNPILITNAITPANINHQHFTQYQQRIHQYHMIFGEHFNPERNNFVPDYNPRTALFFGQFKIGKPYTAEGQYFTPFIPSHIFMERGIASWYGDEFHGRNTANGGQFNMNLVSAAHRTLPLPAIVVITNIKNGRAIKLVINDRGPFAKNRIIDLSIGAAKILGSYQHGTTEIELTFLKEETEMLWHKMGVDVASLAK